MFHHSLLWIYLPDQVTYIEIDIDYHELLQIPVTLSVRNKRTSSSYYIESKTRSQPADSEPEIH